MSYSLNTSPNINLDFNTIYKILTEEQNKKLETPPLFTEFNFPKINLKPNILKDFFAAEPPSTQDPKPFNVKSGTSTEMTSLAHIIDEDSTLRKLLACIPLIGIVPTFLNERSLRAKITNEPDLNRLVKLINVKNHYKIASIVRTVLSIALLVSKVAGLTIASPATVGIIGTGFVALYAYNLFKNMQAITEIKKTGHFLLTDLR